MKTGQPGQDTSPNTPSHALGTHLDIRHVPQGQTATLDFTVSQHIPDARDAARQGVVVGQFPPQAQPLFADRSVARAAQRVGSPQGQGATFNITLSRFTAFWVERLKGEPWQRLAERRGDEGRDVFLWAARRFCGVTLTELGSAVGAEYAAVSVAIKRLERRAAHDRSLQVLQARLTAMLNVAP